MTDRSIKINKEYRQGHLDEVHTDPFQQFSLWFQEACQVMPDKLVNSMVLATVSKDHQPAARMVLLKEYGTDGFVFYTNYLSRKGNEMMQNPAVALLFWWEALERQVRIEGIAEKIDSAKSAAYFRSRPKLSQIAAIASQQSAPLVNLNELQKQFQHLTEEYAQQNPPTPMHWGGYIVKPSRFEYWQGRENRLHDRFQYTREATNNWSITRLFP